MNPTKALLRSLLREDAQRGSEVPLPAAAEHLAHVARLNGILPLLDRCLDRLPNRDAWPESFRDACHEAALAEAVNEVLRREEILRVLEAFARASVKPLLLKGAALAYSHYLNAALRPMCDADLLVPERSLAAAEEALAGLGYTRKFGVVGQFIAYQSSWSCRDRHGVLHHVDLHRRISNAQILAGALGYEEMNSRAVAITALGPHAFAPAPVHALLLACLHRAGHLADPHYSEDSDHPGGDRLIWLYDIHLLLSRMTAEELDGFLDIAAAKRMKAICRDALSHTTECFGTAIPASVLDCLETAGTTEPSESLLNGRPIARMLGDFAAIDTMAGRGRWLREAAFPSSEYMRWKYAGAAVGFLPWLYARRAVHGLWKLLVARRHHRAD